MIQRFVDWIYVMRDHVAGLSKFQHLAASVFAEVGLNLAGPKCNVESPLPDRVDVARIPL